MQNYPVTGNGFVLFDEYDEKGNMTTTVYDFLEQINRNEFDGDAYNIDIIGAYPDMELFETTDEMSDNTAYFKAINGTDVEPAVMLVVRHAKDASMFQAPYGSKEAYIQAIKDQLKEAGLMSYLPEMFDFEAHIGNFRYVFTSV